LVLRSYVDISMKVTALISAYEADEFLRHKIRNIRESSIPVDIIVVETGKNLAKFDRKSIYRYVLCPEKITLYAAINIAIKICRTPYVVMANCDDLVHPEAYERQLKGLEGGADITYFDYFMTGGFHKTWEEAKKHIYNKYYVPEEGYSKGKGLGPFPMWRKSLHDEVGLFDENLRVYGDSLFWAKLKDIQANFKKVPGLLGAYAQRQGQNLESKEGALDQSYLKRLV
jgi:glycosyltransferase involved in cell wall biosynthesis